MTETATRQQVRRVRRALGESTAEFGARFARSGRTVEDWEQGRRQPDKLVRKLLDRLERQLARQLLRPRNDLHGNAVS